MSVKYTLKRYFWCFLSMLHIGCYVKQMKSIQFFNPPSVTYIWGHWWILVQLLISIDWYKYSNTKVLGSKCILNGFSSIIWRPKVFFFLSKCPNYIMGCITDLGSIFFLFSLFWIWHILIISCAKFEAYACSICDVMTIPINKCC